MQGLTEMTKIHHLRNTQITKNYNSQRIDFFSFETWYDLDIE